MDNKIMIIDDERMIIQYVIELLSSWGYDYNFVTKPKRVLENLALDPVDLILLDINMPEIDGITLLKQLKELPEYAHIPVIMMTGDIKEETLATCFEHGASDFITKPIKSLVLKARIKTQIENKILYENLDNKVKERTREIEDKNEELKQYIEELKVTEEMMHERQIDLEHSLEELTLQEEVLTLHKNEIEQNAKRTTESINYAKTIQQAMLPTSEEMGTKLNDFFIFFKPRDIVSGDFYWFSEVKSQNGAPASRAVLAAVDCTGHGVPGAFVSLVGDTYLNQIVNTHLSHPFFKNSI